MHPHSTCVLIVPIAIGFTSCGTLAQRASCDSATHAINDLTADPAAHDGEAAIICASYWEHPGAHVECEPTGGEDPQLQEGEYATYSATWGLEDGSHMLAVEVRSADGASTSTRPDGLEEGDQLVLDGTLHYAEVTSSCDLDILYPSLYLQIDAAQVGLDSKDDEPENLPDL